MYQEEVKFDSEWAKRHYMEALGNKKEGQFLNYKRDPNERDPHDYQAALKL